MKAIIGVDGLIRAQPVADVLSLSVVIIMLCRKIKKRILPNRRYLLPMSEAKTAKRKSIRRIIRIVLAAVLVISASVLGG